MITQRYKCTACGVTNPYTANTPEDAKQHAINEGWRFPKAEGKAVSVLCPECADLSFDKIKEGERE